MAKASFDYDHCAYPVNPQRALAHHDAWQRIARPGSWWQGAERIAIVQAMRDASDCGYCRERADALSPYALDGVHDSASSVEKTLSGSTIDIVHRLTTDPARITARMVEDALSQSFTYGHYVELIGIVVAALSIDTVHRVLGLAPAPLPTPQPGEPDHYMPPGTTMDIGWVPMCTPETVSDRDKDMFLGMTQSANVLCALTCVPEAVHLLHDLAAVHYVPSNQVRDLTARGLHSLSRAQIELVAARTSALNDCFY